MVWIPREIAAHNLSDTSLLTGYILTPIPPSAITKLESRLEHSAALRYNPQMKFKIQHAPDDYIKKTHSYIRAKENEAGREHDWPEIAGTEEEAQAEADDEMCRLFHARMGRCVAEPGDYEESTDDDLLDKIGFPRPDVVARLKPETATKTGMISEWKRFSPVNEYKCNDGSVTNFPTGRSIWLDIVFDSKFVWPEYTWPEGSL